MQVKWKRKPTTTLLCLLTALALCAALLGLYPARAAAAEDDILVAAGAGGGGGGGAGGGGGSYNGGAGGNGGANGHNDGLVQENLGLPGSGPDGGAGGKGADGGLYTNGSTESNAGGAGGTGGLNDNGGNGLPGGSVGAVDAHHPVSGAWGTIQALGGYAGNAGGNAGTFPGGNGGDGGGVYLALDSALTANHIELRGGGSGTLNPATGDISSGGQASVLAGGPLSLSTLKVTGGANTLANGGNGGSAWFETASPLTVGSLLITGGEGTGTFGNAGNAMVLVRAPLTAGSVQVAAGSGGNAYNAGVIVNGLATVGTLIVGGGDKPSVAELNGGLDVPAGKTTTLTATANGILYIEGDIILGEGATLNIENNGGTVDLSNATITVGKGAQFTLPAGVTPKGVNATLSGPPSVDVGADDLLLALSTSYNSVSRVWLNGQPLIPDRQYRVSGSQITIFRNLLNQQAMGPAAVTVNLSDGQTLDHSVQLMDSTAPSFTVTFPDTVGFDISLDGGASWTPLQSGGAVGTAPAAVAGGFFLRQTRGFTDALNRDRMVISGNLSMMQTADLAWNLTVSDAGGGALHGAGQLDLAFTPMPHAYGNLTPDYGGSATAWAGAGALLMRSAQEQAPRLQIAGVVVNDKLLQQGTDWTDATNSPYAVRLSEAYVNTLANGTHTVQLVLVDDATSRAGYAQGTFTVARPTPTQTTTTTTAATTQTPSPKTGDPATALPLALAVLSATGLGGAIALRRRKNK